VAEKDKNPNKVKRSEVDDVFIATAGEIMYRRGSAKRDRAQIRESNLIKASEIVEESQRD
jgi:hypothetical protein